MRNCLAIITARGGSKRIPRKNIKIFLGRPILNYSIDAALKSDCFDEVMVSTDDLEIAEIAKASGAKVPFMRSAASSNDYATTAEVLLEVLEMYKAIGREFSHVCCVFPTAPFITAQKLRTAFSLLVNTPNAEAVIPVVKFDAPILRSLKIDAGFLKMNWPEYINTRSQDLEAAYHDCGQFYFLETEAFLRSKKLFADRTVPMVMQAWEVQDIDTEEDWLLAEMKYRLGEDKKQF